MLSPDQDESNEASQRTTSEPDLTESSPNTQTNCEASQCSKMAKADSHKTDEDLLPVSRVRAISCLSSGSADLNRLRSVSLYTPNNNKGEISKLDGVNGESMDFSRQAFEKLRKDLEQAQKELSNRDTECKLVRETADNEILELTASLFEEANKMVIEANVARMSSEKKYHEAQLQLDGLQAECKALKALVITSTPANPGHKRFHKRAPSAGQIFTHSCSYMSDLEDQDWSAVDPINKKEVDPYVFQSFCSWIEEGYPTKDHQFLTIVHRDDIVPCLRFPNEELSKSIYKAAQSDTLAIEPIKSKPRKCSLTSINGQCPYRIRTPDSDIWFPISETCRARIVTVMDFLTFLRYIKQGIIKKDVNVLYWEMAKKRAVINLARLGLENPK